MLIFKLICALLAVGIIYVAAYVAFIGYSTKSYRLLLYPMALGMLGTAVFIFYKILS